MRILSATLATMLIGTFAGQAEARAQPPASESSGFPGDLGRPPGGGLIPPKGPRPARPPEPVVASPPAALAVEAAQAAVAACAGYHVGVSIIDASGAPKLYYVADGATGWHAYMGFRKAYTALTFKRPNEEVVNLSKSDPAVAAKVGADRNLVVWAGGLPLISSGQIIGAIGVSGAEPSEKDEACALAGINKIKDRL